MPVNTPKQTFNTDVFSLVRRINRFIMEMVKSQSSGISQTMPYDLSRVLSYTASIKSLVAWVVAQPVLDLPETGPMEMPLPESAVVPMMENESVYDICSLFEIMRDELANSQSARLSTNLMKADYDRLIAIVGKIENFIQTYINVSEPLDLPESSPLAPLTGAGRTGVIG